jgi:hypothetical protein
VCPEAPLQFQQQEAAGGILNGRSLNKQKTGAAAFAVRLPNWHRLEWEKQEKLLPYSNGCQIAAESKVEAKPGENNLAAISTIASETLRTIASILTSKRTLYSVFYATTAVCLIASILPVAESVETTQDKLDTCSKICNAILQDRTLRDTWNNLSPDRDGLQNCMIGCLFS